MSKYWKTNKYVKLINYRNSDNKIVHVKKANEPKGIFLGFREFASKKFFEFFYESYSEH